MTISPTVIQATAGHHPVADFSRALVVLICIAVIAESGVLVISRTLYGKSFQHLSLPDVAMIVLFTVMVMLTMIDRLHHVATWRLYLSLPAVSIACYLLAGHLRGDHIGEPTVNTKAEPTEELRSFLGPARYQGPVRRRQGRR